jgi:uncharacterized membrane protein YccC
MSQVIDRRPPTTDAGPRPRGTGRTPRLVMAIVALGLLLGAVAGWSAFALYSPMSPEQRTHDAQTARWEAVAEDALARAAAARRLDIERRRWEAKADHFAPGWRDE